MSRRALAVAKTSTLSTVAALLVAGCPTGADLEDPDSFFADSCDATPIFESSCGTNLCHETEDGLAPFGGVDLLAPGVEERLLNRPASYENVHDPGACPRGQPELLIDTENPEESLLLTKLTGEHACGEAMPTPNPPNELSEQNIDCVRRWIADLVADAPPPTGLGTAGSVAVAGGAGGQNGTSAGGQGTAGAGMGGASR